MIHICIVVAALIGLGLGILLTKLTEENKTCGSLYVYFDKQDRLCIAASFHQKLLYELNNGNDISTIRLEVKKLGKIE